jgi:hypothetical protein
MSGFLKNTLPPEGEKWSKWVVVCSISRAVISLHSGVSRVGLMWDLEQAVPERACFLWVERGRKDGDADAHWFAAEREIASISPSTFSRVITTRQPKAANSKTDNHRSWMLVTIVVVALCLA